MTLLRTSSAESQSSFWPGSGGTISAVAARTGNGIRNSSGASQFIFSPGLLGSSERHNTIIVGFYWAMSSALGNTSYVQFGSPAEDVRGVRLARDTTSGTVGLLRLERWVQGTSSWQTLAWNILNPAANLTGNKYVEIKLVYGIAPDGVFEVRVDEVLWARFTGATLPVAFSNTDVDTIEFTMYGDTTLDDFYIANGAGDFNNDYLGAVRIVPLYPTASGTHSQWTGSDGNSIDNWDMVDDLINVADWVETSLDNATDTYIHQDIPAGYSPSVAVKAVVAHTYAYKGDTAPRTLTSLAVLGEAESRVVSVAADGGGLDFNSYQHMHAVHELKPGGGAWTVAAVNAAEFGLQATDFPVYEPQIQPAIATFVIGTRAIAGGVP